MTPKKRRIVLSGWVCPSKANKFTGMIDSVFLQTIGGIVLLCGWCHKNCKPLSSRLGRKNNEPYIALDFSKL